jgi:hypothetical protein
MLAGTATHVSSSSVSVFLHVLVRFPYPVVHVCFIKKKCVTSGEALRLLPSAIRAPTTIEAKEIHTMTHHIQRKTTISSGVSSPTTFRSSSLPSHPVGVGRAQGAPATAYIWRSSANEQEASTPAQQRWNPSLSSSVLTSHSQGPFGSPPWSRFSRRITLWLSNAFLSEE